MHLIAGIDPGTTTGIAVLDLTGNVVDLFSSKDFGLRKTIKYLISKGTLSLIASDVSPCPKSVARIATKLGVPTYTPLQPLSIREKISLTKEHNPKDSHQRDALAAALSAFHNFQLKFQKIDTLDLEEEKKEKVKHLLLQGFSLEKAQLKLEKPVKEPKELKKPKRKKQKKTKNQREERLGEQVSELRKELSRKETKLKNLERDIQIVKERYRVKLKREEEIQKREEIIQSLRDKIGQMEHELEKVEQLRELWGKIARREIVPLVTFPQRGKAVLINRKLREKDLSALQEIKIAFTPFEQNKKHLREKGILRGDFSKVKGLFGFFYVNSEDLKQAEEEKEEISLEELVTKYREEKG